MTSVKIPPAAPSRSSAIPRPAGRVHHQAGFWMIAAAFLIVIAFAALPTPLYAIYQAKDDFATSMITVIFAAYAVGVMAALYLAGHVSDWLGRRRMILIAIVVELLSAVVFLVWPEVPGLLVARLISGVGVGILSATATAHLSELRLVARPDDGSKTSSVVSSLVNIGGIGLGPLIGGVLAQWVAAPLIVPYLIFIALLVLAAVAVAFVPETVERQHERRAYRPQRISLPRASRGTFFAAGAAAFSSFALFGMFNSLAPSFIAGTLHDTSHFVAGMVVFAVFGAAAIAQVLARRMADKPQLQLAAILMAVGLATMAVGVLTASLMLFLLAGIIAGAGAGVVFRSAVAATAMLAPAAARGEVLAALFLIAYLGLALPALLVGVALAFVASAEVFVGFAAIALMIAVWSSVTLSRRLS